MSGDRPDTTHMSGDKIVVGSRRGGLVQRTHFSLVCTDTFLSPKLDPDVIVIVVKDGVPTRPRQLYTTLLRLFEIRIKVLLTVEVAVSLSPLVSTLVNLKERRR